MQRTPESFGQQAGPSTGKHTGGNKSALAEERLR